MKKSILDVLKEINPAIVDDEELDLLEAGLIDSFDIVNIVAQLESRFVLTIDARDIVPENFSTVTAIVDLVAKLHEVRSIKGNVDGRNEK